MLVGECSEVKWVVWKDMVFDRRCVPLQPVSLAAAVWVESRTKGTEKAVVST